MTESQRQAKGLVRRIVVCDAAAIVVAICIAYTVRFDAGDMIWLDGHHEVSQAWVTLALWCLWFGALRVYHTANLRILGDGSEEFIAIFEVSLRVFGLVALLAFAFHVGLSREFLAIAGTLGLLLLWTSRYLWRLWLRSRQARGQYLRPLLVVGSPASARPLVKRLTGSFYSGYRLVGVCLPGGVGVHGVRWEGAAVLGDVGAAAEVARQHGADAVAVTSTDALSPEDRRDLSWELDEWGIEMIVEPALLNVNGPRISTHPVAGLPLLHVESAAQRGCRRVGKRMFDIAFSLFALVVSVLPMVAIAVAVKVTSRGPVFFRQVRVGQDGKRFRMIKFRSMRVGAENELAGLVPKSVGAGPMFKIRHDPRVTKVGRWLRAYSLDEIPQLLNVLCGHMSLVGPRPPLPSEVAQYGDATMRRLNVKPGMTGLWQVSGRSDLDWEESVRLDLYYADNWTLLEDLVICMRTVKAVVAGAGAY